MRHITIQNLHDSTLHPEHKGEILYCDRCFAEYSANRGDYWAWGKHEVLQCQNCKAPVQLVRKVIVYKPVRHARGAGK